MSTIKRRIKNFLDILRRILPIEVFYAYHYLLAFLGYIIYGSAQRELLLIGVMGSKGKSTTANIIWQILNSQQIKTGLISTNQIAVGDDIGNNIYHNTLPGRFNTVRELRKMRDNGCQVAVLEIAAEAIPFSRELFLQFDRIIFTNLTNEKHSNFKNDLNRTKRDHIAVIDRLYKRRKKKLDIKGLRPNASDKVSYINIDDQFSQKLIRKSLKQYNYSTKINVDNGIYLTDTILSNLFENIFKFKVSEGLGNKELNTNITDHKIRLNLGGSVNISNSLPVILLMLDLGISLGNVIDSLDKLLPVAGRFELIKRHPFTVFVDYAHEQLGMKALLEDSRKYSDYLFDKKGRRPKLTVLLGAEGGGRDKEKRFPMGEIAGIFADKVIVTMVDPYEEDQAVIADGIVKGAESVNKVEGLDLFNIADRKKAIEYSIDSAEEDEIILITGKGAEQSILWGDLKIPHDDRQVSREILNSNDLVIKNKKTDRAYIFDFDGVLVDSTKYTRDKLNSMLRRFNIELSVKDVGLLIGCNMEQKYLFLDEILKSQNKRLKDLISFDEFNNELEVLSKDVNNNCRLIPGILNYLNYLYINNYKLVVATSSNLNRYIDISKRLGIYYYFDKVISSNLLKDSKPSPHIYNKAVEFLDLDKDKIIVFEDSVNGFMSASAAGLKNIVGIKSEFYEESVYSKYCTKVIDNFNDNNLEY